MENVGGNVTSTWTVCVDVSLSTCTSTAEVAAGNTIWPCVRMLSIQQQHIVGFNALCAFFIVFFFFFFVLLGFFWFLFCAFCHNMGKPCCPLQSTTAAALKQSHSKWGILTKERHERGPIKFADYWLHPMCKRLASVTFTWFKSLTPLNQKSMKSSDIFLGWVVNISSK